MTNPLLADPIGRSDNLPAKDFVYVSFLRAELGPVKIRVRQIMQRAMAEAARWPRAETAQAAPACTVLATTGTSAAGASSKNCDGCAPLPHQGVSKPCAVFEPYPVAIAAASAAARCMLDDISLVTVLCSSTAAAVEVTYSLTF